MNESVIFLLNTTTWRTEYARSIIKQLQEQNFQKGVFQLSLFEVRRKKEEQLMTND
ncbi:MAG: hypothetical protein MUE44_02235 [Oscillatoriaceae cyanobacterium Prado104]|nr:hypothetical protein [Oscillatoriaceae cyanobacterium Prado104]